MSGYIPAFLRVSTIERRAEHLSDPIERLRYLRKATAVSSPRRSPRSWILASTVILGVLSWRSDAIVRPAPAPSPVRHFGPVVLPPSKNPNVWPVEQTSDYDLYSNGLRIDNRLAVSNESRSYRPINRESGAPGPDSTQPAGIVFHTSESDQLPFERAEKDGLRRIGQELLLYVRNKRAYHFMIDRFGQVHRIVVESDEAFHAGHSVWADAKWAYVDLNQSFLGVVFEARMRPDQEIITEAQLRAARALIEMLRAKYHIAAQNCVTHAQVSVNPASWRIGWHTDWGAGFPFREVGLPDNYGIPIPSLYLFGFVYDQTYKAVTGAPLWQGLAIADEQVREAAAEHGLTPAEYRKILRQKFKEAVVRGAERNADQEIEHESN